MKVDRHSDCAKRMSSRVNGFERAFRRRQVVIRLSASRSMEGFMSKSMYAVVGNWTMEEDRWEEQVRGLHEKIVPFVHQVPGFVSGTWVGDPSSGKTTSTIVLEDKEAARNFKSFVESNPASREQAGVTLESLTIVECQAEAHR